jgi:hypothetical protein
LKLELTQEKLKEVLSYSEEDGIFTWKIPQANNKIKVGSVAGCVHSSGAWEIGLSRKLFKAHRLAWLYVYGEFPSEWIDHIDGDRTNNRINNLRLCTPAENQMNRKKSVNNTSGFKGVSWDKEVNMWKATVQLDGVRKHLGYFPQVEDASATYEEFCRTNHREFYRKTAT